MVDDRESQLYRDMADFREIIPELQREIKSLKIRTGKLTTRIEKVELLGLQDQIYRLSDKLNELRSEYTSLVGDDFLWVQRKLGEFIIASTLMIAEIIFDSKKHKNALEQLSISSAGALAKVEISETPLEMAIQFYNDCIKLADKSGLRVIKMVYP
jgi:hypothetical protein